MEDDKVLDSGQTDLPQKTPVMSPSENYQVAEALQKVPSLVSRGLLYLVILALTSALLYASLARIDVVAQCRAVATPAVSPVNIQAATTGYVVKVYIAEGQRVEKNTPLFLIQSKIQSRIPAGETGPLTDTAAAIPASPAEKTAEVNSETVVISPAEGTVVHMFISYPGRYVEEYTPLCNILPASDRLFMNILATNREIGFIENNMNVKYKFDAFPYADYGLLYGRVVSIPAAAVENENAGLIYHVQGTLNTSYFNKQGKKYFLRAGMTATAELVRKRTTVLSILFKNSSG